MHLDSIKLAKLGVLDQLAFAAQPRNRLALAVGAILGGLIPIASYVIAHYEAGATPLKWVIVAAGMLYSANSVFEWGTAAFHSRVKSLGFVVLVEGVSLFATTLALSLAAVCVLVAINAASTSWNLIANRKLARRAGSRTLRPPHSKRISSGTKMPSRRPVGAMLRTTIGEQRS